MLLPTVLLAKTWLFCHLDREGASTSSVLRTAERDGEQRVLNTKLCNADIYALQKPKKKKALVRARTSLRTRPLYLVKMNQNAQLLLPLLGLVLVPSGASGLEVAMNDPSILYSPFTWLVTEVKYFTISFFLFFLSGSIGRNFANNLPNSLIFGWKQD